MRVLRKASSWAIDRPLIPTLTGWNSAHWTSSCCTLAHLGRFTTRRPNRSFGMRRAGHSPTVQLSTRLREEYSVSLTKSLFPLLLNERAQRPLVSLPGSIPQKPISTAKLIPPPGPGAAKPQPGELDVSKTAHLGAGPLVASPLEQAPTLPPRSPVAPPAPASTSDEPQREGTASSESELEAIAGIGAPKEHDPYAMLDNAFGYVTDQPQPIQGRNQRNEFGDLLL